MTAVVGTSGWAYPEWQPDVYPAGLPRTVFLRFYAGLLSGCEVNATHYRLQSRDAVARWAGEVPEAFRFVAKAHRAITLGLAGDRDILAAFLASLEPLGTRLAAVLVKVPDDRSRDDEALEGLLRRLPAGTRPVLDFRHPSWDDPDVRARVAGAGGTVCHTDNAGEVPDGLPAGPLAYARLRADRYTDEAREGWARLLIREAAGREVFAFARHEGLPPNDPNAGVGLALWLHRRLTPESPAAASHPGDG